MNEPKIMTQTEQVAPTKQLTADERTVLLKQLLKPERAENETQLEYRQRMKNVKMFQRISGTGRMFWNSAEKGTYVKPKG